MMRNGLLVVALSAATITLFACGGASSPTGSATPTPTPEPTTTFSGTIAAPNGLSGPIAIVVHALVAVSAKAGTLAVASATGTINLENGGTVALTGTYDSSSGALTLSGGGYSFTGTVAKGEIFGTFTAPDGRIG